MFVNVCAHKDRDTSILVKVSVLSITSARGIEQKRERNGEKERVRE